MTDETAIDHPAGDVAETTIEWRGHTFRLPAPEDIPLDAIEAAEDNKIATSLRATFGPAQWATVKAEKPTATDLGDLMEKMAKALGFQTLGE